jgi:hypothetical protein
MKRLLFAIAFFAVFAQGQTVVKKIISNASAPVAVEVPNVQQVGHQAYVQLSDAPGQTCTLPAFSGGFQYSFDESTWTGFGTIPGLGNTVKTFTYYGTGLYNYVRFVVGSFDTTNCVVSAWYTGTSQPVYQAGQGGAPNSVGVTTRGGGTGSLTIGINPVLVGGLGTSGTAPGLGAPTPPTVCDQRSNVLATAGTSAVVLNTGTPSQVCSVSVTLTANGTFQLFLSTSLDTSCTGHTENITPVFTLNAGVPFVVSGGFGSLFSTLTGTSSRPLCVAATGGNAAVWATYAIY